MISKYSKHEPVNKAAFPCSFWSLNNKENVEGYLFVGSVRTKNINKILQQCFYVPWIFISSVSLSETFQHHSVILWKKMLIMWLYVGGFTFTFFKDHTNGVTQPYRELLTGIQQPLRQGSIYFFKRAVHFVL